MAKTPSEKTLIRNLRSELKRAQEDLLRVKKTASELQVRVNKAEAQWSSWESRFDTMLLILSGKKQREGAIGSWSLACDTVGNARCSTNPASLVNCDFDLERFNVLLCNLTNATVKTIFHPESSDHKTLAAAALVDQYLKARKEGADQSAQGYVSMPYATAETALFYVTHGLISNIPNPHQDGEYAKSILTAALDKKG